MNEREEPPSALSHETRPLSKAQWFENSWTDRETPLTTEHSASSQYVRDGMPDPRESTGPSYRRPARVVAQSLRSR